MAGQFLRFHITIQTPREGWVPPLYVAFGPSLVLYGENDPQFWVSSQD